MSIRKLMDDHRAEHPELYVQDTEEQSAERSRKRKLQSEFHKQITFLTKRQQGYVMQAFREVVFGENSTEPTRVKHRATNSAVQAANAEVILPTDFFDRGLQ